MSLDANDRWLLDKLTTPRPFGGPQGICPSKDFHPDSRAYWRRRLVRLERQGYVERTRLTPGGNGQRLTLWRRTKEGDAHATFPRN